MRGADDGKTERSRRLRRDSTRAETLLWNRLRSRALRGFKFVRQEAIGRYVVDFVCREERLIVEVDGGQHAIGTADAARTAWLTQQGYRVIRFWNNDVTDNMPGVLETISAELGEAPPHPRLRRDLSPQAGRGESR